MSRPLLNVARKRIARRPRDPDRPLAHSQTPCASAPPTRQVSAVVRTMHRSSTHIGCTLTTRDCPRKSANRPARLADSGPSGEAPQVGPFAEIAAILHEAQAEIGRGDAMPQSASEARFPPRKSQRRNSAPLLAATKREACAVLQDAPDRIFRAGSPASRASRSVPRDSRLAVRIRRRRLARRREDRHTRETFSATPSPRTTLVPRAQHRPRIRRPVCLRGSASGGRAKTGSGRRVHRVAGSRRRRKSHRRLLQRQPARAIDHRTGWLTRDKSPLRSSSRGTARLECANGACARVPPASSSVCKLGIARSNVQMRQHSAAGGSGAEAPSAQGDRFQRRPHATRAAYVVVPCPAPARIAASVTRKACERRLKLALKGYNCDHDPLVALVHVVT